MEDRKGRRRLTDRLEGGEEREVRSVTGVLPVVVSSCQWWRLERGGGRDRRQHGDH